MVEPQETLDGCVRGNFHLSDWRRIMDALDHKAANIVACKSDFWGSERHKDLQEEVLNLQGLAHDIKFFILDSDDK